MCGRYQRKSDKQRLAEAFHLTGGLDGVELLPDEDVRPTTVQPIIRANRDTGERDLVLARWGFVPGWQRPQNRLPANLFNARSEGIERAAMWSKAFAAHRCLVPAECFFEWKKLRPRNNPKFAFWLNSRQPFAFAGLWGAWKNPATNDWLQSFTIITTDPNELCGQVHDRMPVILHPKDYDRWLSREKTVQPPVDLLRPYEADGMQLELADNQPDEIVNEPNST